MNSILHSIDGMFAETHSRSSVFLAAVSNEILFERPRELPRTFTMFSIGEYLIRSAAEVEQVIGGITTRLWDDPFEWTLPEELNSTAKIAEYLDEVESERNKGFGFFNSDTDLSRSIPAPERLKTIFELLAGTLARSSHYQGRAFAIFQMFSDEKLPQF
ncbi:MAG: hypothetical protein ABI791_04365 [Acidobacteriota bacterium]